MDIQRRGRLINYERRGGLEKQSKQHDKLFFAQTQHSLKTQPMSKGTEKIEWLNLTNQMKCRVALL